MDNKRDEIQEIRITVYSESGFSNLLEDVVDRSVSKKIQELQTMDPRHKYIPSLEVCETLGISPRTLLDWDNLGKTKPFKFGRTKKYRLSDIHQIIEQGWRGNPPKSIP